jgi:endonuclease/exonuclease/phosphatase family metal-dependent hydrolase
MPFSMAVYDSVKPISRGKKRKMTWFSRIVLFFNYFAAVSLLLSGLAQFISPASFWPIAFFGIGYQFILAGNGLFLLYWVIRWRKQAWIPLVAILLTSFNIPRLFQVKLSANEAPKDSFKVMSWNVRLFDLYNWSHNKLTRNRMFSFIKKEEPAIACFQEYFQGDSGYFNTTDTLVQFLGAKNAHVEFTLTLRRTHHWGIATYTRFPILNRGRINFEGKSNNICIYTDVLIGKDTVRIYNMHLQSFLFSKQDYKFVEDIQQNKEVDEIEGSKSILARMKSAFISRAPQAQVVASHIAVCPYPIILCGDFNDTPFSYTYHQIKGSMSDCFMESGSGLGKSYYGDFPSFRIDYIFHSSAFRSCQYTTHPEDYSDHFALTTMLSKE